MNLALVADLAHTDLARGAELFDQAFLCRTSQQGRSVRFIYSRQLQQVEPDTFYYLSNFIGLSREARLKLEEHGQFAIIEHDHKYAPNRNPAQFQYLLVPPERLQFMSLYQKARAVFTMSRKHQETVGKNIQRAAINLSGSLWLPEHLRALRTAHRLPKNGKFCMMKHADPAKGSAQAEAFLAQAGPYTAIPEGLDPIELFTRLGQHSCYVFLPLVPESLSRITVEARLAGLAVVAAPTVPAIFEPWYSLPTEELQAYVENDMAAEITRKLLAVSH